MIVDTAMQLFFEHGYDATTMEQIAESASIGTSTVYRYFPTKEAVVMGYLGDPSLMAEELRTRPEREVAEVALGHALLAFLSHATLDADAAGRFAQLLEDNPRPRAGLQEWLGAVRTDVARAISERTGHAEGDLHDGSLAWTALYVIEQATSRAGSRRSAGEVARHARQVMEELTRRPLTSPRIDD